MISDILSDASQEITRYLTDMEECYPVGSSIRARIESLQVEMDAVRKILDTPPERGPDEILADATGELRAQLNARNETPDAGLCDLLEHMEAFCPVACVLPSSADLADQKAESERLKAKIEAIPAQLVCLTGQGR